MNSLSHSQRRIDRGRKSVDQLNKSAQAAINICAIILPLIFTYLSFRGIPIMDVLQAISEASVANILWKCVLAIYFLLWVLGTRADAETQALVYLHVDNKGKLPVSAIGVIAALLIFATILLYSRNFEEFTLALAAFFIVNVLAWGYLVRFVVRPIISASRAIYAGEPDAVGSEKLTIVETLICGRWQLWRYFAGSLVIAMLGGIAFLKHNGGGLPGLHPVVSWDLIQVFVMTLYVSVMEIWIWWERLRASVSLELLDDLGERYILRAVSN